MSSNVDKVKVILRFNGEWVERNEGWDYVCTDETVDHRVKLFSNGTHQHLLEYVRKKCGIDASVGQTKVVYKHDGEILMLTDDEDVSAFMESAGNSHKPSTLFVDVDYSMCDGGGTSNTTTQEGANESQIDMSTVNPTYSHDHTYGLNDFYDDVVPETQQQQQQQQQEGQQQADDEEEDHDDEEDDEEDDDEEDDEGVTLRVGVNDYFEMHVFVPTPEVSTTTNQTVPYNRSSRVKKGQVFETKNEMIIELGIKCLQEGFEYRMHRSSKTRYEVLCVNSGCAQRMTMRLVGNNTMFHVRFFNDVHTCSRTQMNSNHCQANKKVLGALIKKILRANRTYQPRDIVDDINQQFGLSIGYATGWRARWNALDSIRGSPSESFTRLPAYLYNLELTNPGTQTSIRVDTKGRFEECFVALGVAVHAAHLKGPYLGTMFLVVAMDGNNNIVPIAFGVGAKSPLILFELTIILAVARPLLAPRAIPSRREPGQG
ncbi:hypothetical protein OSB04_027857 [Centaurea solstitialis]|uniref:Transposase MuDR plant domain-containing protein n=1 Tax=Centaurea solstitialis TaxID=347529 RepID=A0AA38SSX3_9ASTR|nr:hypothetical protein OSB04_027857 [Centaurea solstitialis]